jgi:subfamily B ATP-binding cassette protein MsbA
VTNRTAGREKTSHEGLRSLGTLRPYLAYLEGQRRDMAVVVALMIVSTGLSLVIPLIVGRFLDRLVEAGQLRESLPVLALLGGLLLAQLLFTYLGTVLSSRLGWGYVTRLRKQLMAHMLALPCLFFTRQKAGDLASRMTSDVGSIQYILTSGIVSLARAALTLVGAVVLMFLLNRALTLVILVSVPATILLVRMFGRQLQRLSRKLYDELGRINAHVQQVAGAVQVIKVFNNQAHEEARFAGMVERYYADGFRRARLQAALESAAQFLMWVCFIVVMVYGGWLTARGEMTIGDLTTFILYAYRVAYPLGMLTGLYGAAQGAVAAADRLEDVFACAPEACAPEARGGEAGGGTAPGRGAITLEDVTFAYDRTPVIRDLSLRIEAGEWVGIVGPSGAGKTTLTGLIMRLWDPGQGRLLLDGRPYTDLDLAELRGQMAYVSQDPVLYDVTVRENICFGLEGVPDGEVREAARRANALEFIEALPDGFETVTGERGVRLSGGERQRITLARAFLRNPRILVLDEPTSALDARSEEAVREALTALMAGRTAVVIAHRLSLVRDLQRIFVMADGRLAEAGDHDELMARGGLYAGLYRLQHGT